MIILSIDIGIKNLGYIIFNIGTDNIIEIIDWNIINLCEYRPKCCICLERSSFIYNSKYYCQEDAKGLDISINNLSKSVIKSMTKKELVSICKEYNLDIDIKNKRDKIEAMINENFKYNYLNYIDDNVAKRIGIVDVGINIKYNLNKVFSKIKISSIDTILIENQIGPLANRMKTVQGMVAQYFIDNSNYNIEFVSSKNKMDHRN